MLIENFYLSAGQDNCRSRCDANAVCVRVSTYRYQCICNQGYRSNGISCVPGKETVYGRKLTSSINCLVDFPGFRQSSWIEICSLPFFIFPLV